MLPTFFTFYKRGRTIFMPNINHTKYCNIDISIHSNYIEVFQSLCSLDLLWGTWCRISKRGHSEVTSCVTLVTLMPNCIEIVWCTTHTSNLSLKTRERRITILSHIAPYKCDLWPAYIVFIFNAQCTHSINKK